MSNISGHEGAEVVSLEEFRKRIEVPEQEPEDTRYNHFQPADYITNTCARRMLRYLNGSATPNNLAIFIHDTSDPTLVVASEQERSWGYAVARNIDEIEALTLDLEYGDETREQQLREPLDRFCTLSFIARHAISRDCRVTDPQTQITLTVKDEMMNIEDHDRSAFINTWRAAGGLALIGITEGRPSLRKQMRTYLGKVLSNRLEYAQDAQFIATISQRHVPQDALEISDELLGLCNPFNGFELSSVLVDLGGSPA